MTAAEAYELTTHGGATDFARLIASFQSFGSYCLIGGLAVNCYVEPVYTLDADFVVITARVNLLPRRSALRVQFTLDERYQPFLARSIGAEVLGTLVQVASLEDVVQGKLWAYGDPRRRLSKRKRMNWI